MSAPSRRMLLAGGLALPSLALPSLALPALALPALAQPAEPLTLLVTTEGLPTGERLLQEFAATHRHLFRELILQEEDPAWLATGLTQAVRSGRPGVDVVLTNAAGFALGATQDIWQPLPPGFLAANESRMNAASRTLQPLTEGSGLVVGAGPGGPFLLHRSSVLRHAPHNPAALLDYARQNPGRFLYPRPRESIWGQIFVTALPHLLRDRDPADPQSGWDRSWAFLQELGLHVGYYPSSGTATLEEFAEGGCDLTPCLLAPFLLGRSFGVLPEDTACSIMHDTPLIPHGFTLGVPRGLPVARRPAVQAFADFLMTPRIQTLAFGRGLVAGTGELDALEAATLSLAERDVWTQAMTPDLAATLERQPLAPPLAPFQLAYMLREWDGMIGARFGEAR